MKCTGNIQGGFSKYLKSAQLRTARMCLGLFQMTGKGLIKQTAICIRIRTRLGIYGHI